MVAGEGDDAVVLLQCPATYQRVSLVRAAAANITLSDDFDIDAISDTKMAIDEVCSELITGAAPDATLKARLHAQGGVFTAELSAESAAAEPIEQDTFGWRVLSALTDHIDSWVEPAVDGSGHRMVVAFTKKTGSTTRQGLHAPPPAT